jgi:hypothetical protein
MVWARVSELLLPEAVAPMRWPLEQVASKQAVLVSVEAGVLAKGAVAGQSLQA